MRRSAFMRRVTSAALSLAAAATFMVVSSAPANAASCYGYSCDGSDPLAAGCSADAYTVSTFNTYWNRYVEHRYSPACGAAWIRYSTSVKGSTLTIYSYSKTTGTLLNLESAYPAAGSGWSLMVPAAYKNVRICAKEEVNYPGYWEGCGTMHGYGGNGTPQPQSMQDPV